MGGWQGEGRGSGALWTAAGRVARQRCLQRSQGGLLDNVNIPHNAAPVIAHPPPSHCPLQIDTLFPSPKTEQGIKGGVVLLRMSPPQGGSRPLQLAVGYTDREGRQYRCVWGVGWGQGRMRWWVEPGWRWPLASCSCAPVNRCPALLWRPGSGPPPRRCCSTKRTVGLPEQAATASSGGGGSFFESSGVEKAVLLARYTDILHDWWGGRGACSVCR